MKPPHWILLVALAGCVGGGGSGSLSGLYRPGDLEGSWTGVALSDEASWMGDTVAFIRFDNTGEADKVVVSRTGYDLAGEGDSQFVTTLSDLGRLHLEATHLPDGERLILDGQLNAARTELVGTYTWRHRYGGIGDTGSFRTTLQDESSMPTQAALAGTWVGSIYNSCCSNTSASARLVLDAYGEVHEGNWGLCHTIQDGEVLLNNPDCCGIENSWIRRSDTTLMDITTALVSTQDSLLTGRTYCPDHGDGLLVLTRQ